MPKKKSGRELINFLRDADDITRLVTGKGIKDFVGRGIELFGDDVIKKFTKEEKVKLSPDNPYVILGVRPEASTIVIKAAYRAMAKEKHPDAGGNPEDFKKIQEAYEEIMRQRGERP